MAFSALFAVAAAAQNDVFSTYDHTLSVVGPEPFTYNEWWADVKMPGGFPTTAVNYPVGFPATADNRNTYVVGTIEVNRTDGGDLFSGQPASTGINGPGAFGSLGIGVKRQVVMLQFNDVLNNGNFTQRYFYGTDRNGQFTLRAANARGISVWRDANPLNDRIAICGETYDEQLPQPFGQAAWLNATATNSSGFIAVYNGIGTLLWTRHFFDPNNLGDQSCAITDLSIRVDDQGNDVVTYCGISSLGSPAGGEMAPLQPFQVGAPCNSGDAVLPAGQWDGFVGRVVFDGANVNRVFHSVVGGPGQDGLFGIAEIDENRFVVVGSAQAAQGAGGFPYPNACGLVGPYVLGAVLEFDATGLVVGGAGNLGLVSTQMLGRADTDAHTMARDVWIGRQVDDAFQVVTNKVYVVGSTDDAAFATPLVTFTLPPPAGQDTLQGATDGFVAVLLDDGALAPWTFSYHGGQGNDGLVGINGWDEFSEHFTVVGFTDSNNGDIDVATYFFNNAIGGAGGNPPNNSNQLLRIRQRQLGGAAIEQPAAMGDVNAMTFGLGWNPFGLGQAAGGGVAVGEDGRCNTVGSSNGGGYPVIPPPPVARAYDAGFDAVRTMADMLPQAVGGTGRTDGTGFQTGVATPFPPLLASGYTGGTTPFCALSEFGLRIEQPVPVLQRMLIDIEGNVVANSTDVAILVSRPTSQLGTVAAGVLQLSFPPTTPWAYITGCEIWLGDPSQTYAIFPDIGADRAYRLPLAALPPGVGPMSAQMVCLLAAPITGANPNCTSSWSASPALWFNW